MQRRIGILGGTFNPIHYGHLAAAEEVWERLKLDEVVFIPSSLPPHKKEEEIPSALQRLEMVRLAIEGNNHFSASDLELKRGGRSYTIDTISELKHACPGAGLFFITGVDSFLEIETWKQWQELLGLCTFVVLSRPGYRFSDLFRIGFFRESARQLSLLDSGDINQISITTDKFKLCLEAISHYDISSRDIRKRILERRTIKYLLPQSVEHYIIKNKLYG